MSYLIDTAGGLTTNGVDEDDDPLVEFEAWIASGAVQIVDKL